MKKYVLLSVLLLTFCCVNTFAQSRVSVEIPFHFMKDDSKAMIQQPQQTPQDVSDELKTQSQILSELRVLRAVAAEKEKQIAALNGQINTQVITIQVITEQKDFYRQASLERKTAGGLDDQNIILLRQQIAEDRSEIKDLRNENDRLRTSRDFRTILGTGVGAGLGYLAGSKQCRQ